MPVPNVDQSIWHQVETTDGLQRKYQENNAFYVNIRNQLLLTFIPISVVIDELLSYFEKISGLDNSVISVTHTNRSQESPISCRNVEYSPSYNHEASTYKRLN